MTDAERARYSLAARVFHATLMGSVVLGLVALAIGLGLYTNALIGQYLGQAFSITPSAAHSLTHGADPVAAAREVIDIYRGLSEEQRRMTGTPEYRALYAGISADDGFDRMKDVLRGYANSGDVDDVYFAM